MTLLWATHLISLQNGKSKDRGRRLDAIGELLYLWGFSRCSYLTCRSSQTLTGSRFPERRLERGAISFFASGPGKK
jgi:hypothetical protein